MRRTVGSPFLILAALAWLLAGLVVAGLVDAALQSDLPPNDPRLGTFGLAAAIVGGAVALVGFLATLRLVVRRRASQPPSDGARSGALAINTLRNDAVQRPRAVLGRIPSPVPPVAPKARGGAGATPPWAPGGSPPPAASRAMPAAGQPPTAGSSGTWAWRPAGSAATARPKASIPGAKRVATASTAHGKEGAASTRGASVLPAALALIGGGVLAYQQSASGAVEASGWVAFAVLLLLAGALAAGAPGRGLVGPGAGLGIVAAAPMLVLGFAAAAAGSAGAVDALGPAIVAAIAAAALTSVGASLGGSRQRLR